MISVIVAVRNMVRFVNKVERELSPAVSFQIRIEKARPEMVYYSNEKA